MEHVDRISINGNPNIGLLAFCTDEYCLVGKDANEEAIKKIEKILKVKVHQISIAGTGLIGVFVAGNNKKILIPGITFDSEKKALEELNIPFEVIETKYTALGNNILCNDEGALVNPEMDVKQIEKALGVPAVSSVIADLEIVGALCAMNDKGALIHRDATDKEIDVVEKILKVPVDIGTLNFGSPYIRSAVILNNKGFLAGDSTTGPEMQNADYAFGFIKDED